MKLFETPRLIARHMTADDTEAMFAVYSDPEAMTWVDDGQPIQWDECVGWVAITLKNYQTRGYGMSALVVKDGGEVGGFMGIVHPGGQAEPELKYAFLKKYWGKGLATEAARGMIAYGHKQLGLTSMIATTDPENKASHRVLEKAGMRFDRITQDEDGDVWVFSWAASPSGA